MRTFWVMGLVTGVGLCGCEGLQAYDGRMSTGTEAAQAVVTRGKLRIHQSAEGSAGGRESTRIVITQIQFRRVDGSFIHHAVPPFDLDVFHVGTAIETLIAYGQLPAGDYDHMRLITEDEGEVTYSSGETKVLNFPSGPQTGIKVFFDEPVQIREGSVTVLNLSFDLSRSFVIQGGTGEELFKPVLRAGVEQFSESELDDDQDEDPELPGGDVDDTDLEYPDFGV